ncbi:FeoA family protein [Bremerella sp. T1]|uniref:FeoA family protein n=1 Tax=Bremerella sp. TYQ1 TaxID=3119568 RepID=UPI001CCFEEB9|nr:FeoA domain-containing protein [Bremerella volcania]UBM36024.1 ferrous iron transport protein A [Bremerella volcania]
MLPDIPLSMVQPGSVVRISQIVGGCDDVKRMAEMGLQTGTEVEMLQSGSPCIVRVGQSKLCFRQSDILNILVNTDET